MALQKWNEIERGSKITLLKNMILKSFNDEVRSVNAGKYYIVGFWVDMCGISPRQKDVYRGIAPIHIKSTELKAFENIN